MLDMERPLDGAVVTAPAPPANPDGARDGRGVLGGLRGLGGRGPKRPDRGDGVEPGSYDLRNSWQVVVGSVLIPLGVVFILIAWYGAAHAKVVQQQIPYMVSGSFIGLGCMVVGGFLFWGHWLYRVYDQADLHHEEQQRLLEQLLRALSTNNVASTTAPDGASAAAAPAGAAGQPSPTNEPSSDGLTYYATASGTVYHQFGCTVIGHHPVDLRVLGPSGLTGLRPCQICLPS
jgi:hypothetical protein